MDPNPPDAGRARLEFLKACTALAPEGSCDAFEGGHLPVMRALMTALLPFGGTGLPLSPAGLPGSLESSFSGARAEYLPCLRNALLLFEDGPRFGEAWEPAREGERRNLEAHGTWAPEAIERQLAKKLALDAKAYESFRRKHAGGDLPFSGMAPAERRDYLWLWSQSAFGLKRRFARGLEALIRAWPNRIGREEAYTRKSS